MKKLVLFTFAVFIAMGMKAQEGIHITFAGMPQNIWIFNPQDTDDARDNFSYKVSWGWAGVASLGYNFADPIGFRLGALYSKQGQIHTSTDSTLRVITTKRELTYVKIPLTLHINGDMGPVMFTADIGPQIGLMMDASIIEDGITIDPGTVPTDLFIAKDISFTWALGANTRLTDWLYFTLQHRGDYGLIDMENKEILINGNPFYNPDRDKAVNATFGILAGFDICILPSSNRGPGGQLWIR